MIRTDQGCLPNFIIIGAGKSGTTSLYHYLRQHPQIFMSAIKEPKFFALEGDNLDFRGPGDRQVLLKDTIVRREDYLQLFNGADGAKAIGEASTIYMNEGDTAEKIAESIPDVRIIAILRHPADRAFSAYMHLRRDGRETIRDFSQALALEPERIRQGYYFHWHYLSRGFYCRQLERYYRVFPPDQIKIYLYEDFARDTSAVLEDIFRFLRVDLGFPVDTTVRHNQSGIPRNPGLHRLLIKSNPVKEWLKHLIPETLGHRIIFKLQQRNVKGEALMSDIRHKLTEIFREDITGLQKLIKRDLSSWLQDDP